ncbi:hypothetical protein CDEF62S_01614 [Castellaniella defragrans]
MLIAAAPVHAEKSIRVLGWYGNQPQSRVVERPFWDNLSRETDGKFSAKFRTIDELGLKGFESMRTVQSGAFDILSFQISFVGGDAPVLMGADLPGAAFDFPSLRNNLKAYKPILEKTLAQRFHAKLLNTWLFPFQILFCKGSMNSLADLKGKKVRVSGIYTAEMAKALGAVGVSLAGPEVYQGLMQGIVDCAITGSQYANSNDWYEVSDTLVPAPLGGAGVVLYVATQKFWNSLSADEQAVLSKQMGVLEDKLWAITEEGNQDGINCNIGKSPCKDGKMGKMKLLEPTDADRTEVRNILKRSILPVWEKNCSKNAANCGQEWMDTIGKQVGLQ